MAKSGAIWSKKTNSGDLYLSISLDCPVIIADPERFGLVAFEFRRTNGEARRENDPRFTLHISEQRQQQADAGRDFDDDERQPARRPARPDREATPGQHQRGAGRDFAADDDDPFADS